MPNPWPFCLRRRRPPSRQTTQVTTSRTVAPDTDPDGTSRAVLGCVDPVCPASVADSRPADRARNSPRSERALVSLIATGSPKQQGSLTPATRLDSPSEPP